MKWSEMCDIWIEIQKSKYMLDETKRISLDIFGFDDVEEDDDNNIKEVGIIQRLLEIILENIDTEHRYQRQLTILHNRISKATKSLDYSSDYLETSMDLVADPSNDNPNPSENEWECKICFHYN